MKLVSLKFFLFSFAISETEGLFSLNTNKQSSMVNIYGRVRVSATRTVGGLNHAGERPADPTTLLEKDQLEEKILMVNDDFPLSRGFVNSLEEILICVFVM
jgi:hypothetical protein